MKEFPNTRENHVVGRDAVSTVVLQRFVRGVPMPMDLGIYRQFASEIWHSCKKNALKEVTPYSKSLRHTQPWTIETPGFRNKPKNK